MHASARWSCSSSSTSTKLRDDYAGTLSGGQRKLLELARALMAEPRFLLLDEPMAGINPTLGAACSTTCSACAREEGVTFLFVEHDMEVVMNHSDRVIVMAEGRVIADGDAGRGARATSASSTPTSAAATTEEARSAGSPRTSRGERHGEPWRARRAILSTEDLVAGYLPEVDILNGVSIKVREGEIVTDRRP